MSEDVEISKKILELVVASSPGTVEDLIEQAHRSLGVPRDILVKHVIDLQNEGKLTLAPQPRSISVGLGAHLFSFNAFWFWLIIMISTTTIISVYMIPEKTYPYVYIRYIVGSASVLLLPGYSLVKALFPTREIDNIEKTALGIGMSIALVPLIGLLLNYTPWGIRLAPVTICLLALTIILTIVGLIREHQELA